MAAFSKLKLSGSTNGKQIKVTGTDSGGAVTIHTAVSGTTDFDEIWIYAVNHGASTVLLTIQWGGTSSPDDLIEVNLPSQAGYVLVVPGCVLQNAAVVKAFAGSANEVLINGFVNRITA